MKSSIRPSTPDDAPALAALMFEAGLLSNAAPRELCWKYWQQRGDWPRPRSFVMTRGSEILAHAGVIPATCATGDRRFGIIHVIDWAARRSATGVGVTLMKYLGQSTDALLAIGGSAETLRILPHLGFRSCGSTTAFVRPVHPVRILTPSVHAAWRLPPRFLRSVLWTLNAPSPSTDGWQVRAVSSSETSAVASVFPTPTRDMAVLERNEELFRYVLTCPIAPMRLYAMEKGGRVRGYFLLAFALGQARLADCWMESEEGADWRALIHCAVREAKRDPRAAELVTWASDPALSRCLLECGFHARAAFQVQLRSADSNMPRKILRLQMLDNDAAYRHPGRSEFLA
ncbi:MAG: hypothetical protein JWN85_3889 [Gammaproteobacteria bacterium]|nr:hypothetical protein [Gammaproteobacteria bacterium]